MVHTTNTLTSLDVSFFFCFGFGLSVVVRRHQTDDGFVLIPNLRDFLSVRCPSVLFCGVTSHESRVTSLKIEEIHFEGSNPDNQLVHFLVHCFISVIQRRQNTNLGCFSRFVIDSGKQEPLWGNKNDQLQLQMMCRRQVLNLRGVLGGLGIDPCLHQQQQRQQHNNGREDDNN